MVHIPVYRAVARRWSSVYVDAALRPAAPDHAAHRLAEPVYVRMEAMPGDQIQDRVGGNILVKEDGSWFPVRLAEPRAKDVATAFSHAELAGDDDRTVVDDLVEAGHLVDAKPRRVRGVPNRTPLPLLHEDAPLILSRPLEGAELS